MGFDKPDLGFVVHLGAPPSPIAYYQQVGRAGRAVEHAEVVLLPGAEDAAIWRYFASLAFPPEEQVRSVLADLSPDRPLSTPALEPLVDLRRARLELMLKVLDVDGAVRRTRGGWLATGEPWTYDTARLRRVAEARTAEQRSMIEYASTTDCRMEFLRRCLDDPEAKPCGRCDTCAEPLFDAEVSPASLAAAHAFLGRPGVEIAPKKLWPTGMDVGRRAAQGQDRARPSRSRPGRAVGRLSDLGWGGRLRALVAPGGRRTARSPTTSPAAVVEVLKAWAHGDDGWAAAPGGGGGGRFRHAARSWSSRLAERIATVGRLPLLGTLTSTHVVRRRAARQQRPAGPGPARRLHRAAGPGRRGGRRGRAGAAGRRPGRLRLDDGAGRPGPAAGAGCSRSPWPWPAGGSRAGGRLAGWRRAGLGWVGGDGQCADAAVEVSYGWGVCWRHD